MAEKLGRYDMVVLSGTSGGAICALSAWYASSRNDQKEAARPFESF